MFPEDEASTELVEAGIINEDGQLALFPLTEAETNELESAVYPIEAYEEASCWALMAR